MSILFSDLDRSDFIRESNTLSHFTYSRNSSPISDYRQKPSRRSMLRELNRTFKKQIKEVDSCFREANQKYNSIGMRKTCESALLLGRNVAHPSYDNMLNFEMEKKGGFEAQSDDEGYYQDIYFRIVQTQHRLQQQINRISQAVPKRIKMGQTQLQSISNRSPIKWKVLMTRQDQNVHRYLYKTEFGKQREDYIAYTEKSSIQEIPNETSNDQRLHSQYQKNCRKRLQQYQNNSLAKMNKGKNSIQNRILGSSCTTTKIMHPVQISQSKEMMNRLKKEKRQREQMIGKIKMRLK